MKSDFGVEHGDSVAKAKDMSVYRQREWLSPKEQKAVSSARKKNARDAVAGIAVGAGLANSSRLARTKKGAVGLGLASGAAAVGFGTEIGRRSAKFEPLTAKAAHRYYRAGGTDDIAGVNRKNVSKSAFGIEHDGQVAKGFTFDRKKAKKDAAIAGGLSAAAGGVLGSAKQPLYRMKKGGLVPAKVAVKAPAKSALALGAAGATAGALSNLGYKKKKG